MHLFIKELNYIYTRRTEARKKEQCMIQKKKKEQCSYSAALLRTIAMLGRRYLWTL